MTEPQGKQRTILLVEDEAITATVEKRILQKHGFQVLDASSGESAIETVKNTGHIDLILMDMNLGDGMDGGQAAQIIVAERDIPVIFLSIYTQQEVVEKTDEIPSSYGYVVKGSGEAVLIASVNMALRLHEAHRELKKREEALKESEERFAVVFHSGPTGISLTRLSDGLVLDVNKAFLRLLGYERDEVVGRNLLSLGIRVNPEDRTSLVDALRDRVKVSDFETTFRTKTGELREVSIATELVDVAHEHYILGHIRDITERKRAEEKLRTSALQLADAADLAKIAYWEHEETTDEFIFNDSFYALYGTTALQEGGYRMAREEYFKRFVHPDDLDGLLCRIEEGRAGGYTGGPAHYEHRAIRADGEVIHILSRSRVTLDREGRVIGAIGADQDITERKRSEEALQESETKFRAIFEGSRDAMWVSKNGIHTYANPAYVSLSGHESADELIGTPVMNLIAHESRAFVMEMMKNRIKGEAIPVFCETTVLKKDGTTYPAESSISTYALRGEEFTLGIVRDITERKQAEEKLKRYELLSENSRDIILLVRRNDKAIVEANAAAEKAYGYTREELLRLTIKDLHGLETPGLTAQQLSEADRNGILFETTHRRADGTTFPVEVSSHGATVGGTRTLISIIRDITERTQVEEALRESETKLRAIFDGSRDAIVVSKEEIRIFANPAYVSLFSFESADELIGRPAIDLIAPESRGLVRGDHEEARRG